jgi:hypothetical protein
MLHNPQHGTALLLLLGYNKEIIGGFHPVTAVANYVPNRVHTNA